MIGELYWRRRGLEVKQECCCVEVSILRTLGNRLLDDSSNLEWDVLSQFDRVSVADLFR